LCYAYPNIHKWGELGQIPNKPIMTHNMIIRNQGM
jgi:hypothetical protein